MKSEWASRPKVLPPTGRRKATGTYCLTCLAWHSTARAVAGDDACPAIVQARTARRERLFAAPHIQRAPKAAHKVELRGG